MSQLDHLIGSADVAAILGWSKAKVKRAAQTGLLPYAAKGPGETGAYLFLREEIERYAAEEVAS